MKVPFEKLEQRVAELEARLAALDSELEGVPAIRLNRADARMAAEMKAQRNRANDPALDWGTLDHDERGRLLPHVKDRIGLVARHEGTTHAALRAMLNDRERADLTYRQRGPVTWVRLSPGRTHDTVYLSERSTRIPLASMRESGALLKAGVPADMIANTDDGPCLIPLQFRHADEIHVMPESGLAALRDHDVMLDAEIRSGRVAVRTLGDDESKRLAIASILKESR